MKHSLSKYQKDVRPDVCYFVLSKCTGELLVGIVRLGEVSTEQSHIATVPSRHLTAPAHARPAVDGGPGVPHQHHHLVHQVPPQEVLGVGQAQADDLQGEDGEQSAEEREKPGAPAVQGAAPPPECRVPGEANVVPLFVVQVGTQLVKITAQN